MKFMNRWEIAEAVSRHTTHPVLAKASMTLLKLMDLTDQVSDGWAYWTPPSKAARRLIELVEGDPQEATEERYRRAMVPVRMMLTRYARVFQKSEVKF